MTPCNHSETDQTKAKNFIPTTSPVIPSITHKAAKPPKFLGPRPLRSLSYPLHAFHQAARFQKKKRSGIGSKRRYFGVQNTRRARPSDSPGREGYKETSGEGRSRGCHHVEEKGFVGSPFRNPRSSIVVSHGSSSYRTNGKRRGEKLKKKKRKYRDTKEMVGISVGCPKLYRLRALIPD